MKMSIDRRIKTIELFKKVAENEYCDCRKRNGNVLNFSKSKVIFNRPYFSENGDFILLGYCVCSNCGNKVYVKISSDDLIKCFGGNRYV